MTHVTCRLTAKNWDQLRNTTLGNRVWACLGSSYSTAHFAFGPRAPPAKTLEGSGWAHLYAFARAPRTLDSPLITRLFVLIATALITRVPLHRFAENLSYSKLYRGLKIDRSYMLNSLSWRRRHETAAFRRVGGGCELSRRQFSVV